MFCDTVLCMATESRFKNGAPVYVFTNENIAGYMPSLGDMTGARVLAVGASGDHAFESYLAGATHVDTFDINATQNNIIELKTHMIRHLPYEDFLDFFVGRHSFFDIDILKPIQNKFSCELKDFLKQYQHRGRRLFWYRDGISPGFDMFKISYMQSPDKYYELREKLPERINFTNCDIRGISTHFTQKYDVILLSNIADYVYGAGVKTYEKLLPFFYRDIIIPISQKNLAYENGRICMEYLWGACPSRWDKDVQNLQNNVVVRQTHNFHHKIFGVPIKGADRGSEYDYAIILNQRVR